MLHNFSLRNAEPPIGMLYNVIQECYIKLFKECTFKNWKSYITLLCNIEKVLIKIKKSYTTLMYKFVAIEFWTPGNVIQLSV